MNTVTRTPSAVSVVSEYIGFMTSGKRSHVSAARVAMVTEM